MKALLKVSIVLLSLGLIPQAQAQSGTEEAKIKEIAARWESAWNAHEMKALAALFTENADFVNVGAKHWKGRTEVETQHSARLTQFRDSTWSTKDVAVQFLSPDIALVHVSWALKGDKDSDGTLRPSREGVFTWVTVKVQAEWLIRAAQNTNRSNLPSPTIAK